MERDAVSVFARGAVYGCVVSYRAILASERNFDAFRHYMDVNMVRLQHTHRILTRRVVLEIIAIVIKTVPSVNARAGLCELFQRYADSDDLGPFNFRRRVERVDLVRPRL